MFDLGGVLVELAGVPTMLSWTRRHIESDELWRRWLTSPSVRAFESGRTSPDDFADALIAEFELPVQPPEFLAAFTSWPRGLLAGALELVNEVPTPIARVTLSNTNCLHWPRLMTEMGLSEVFDFHFASHLTGNMKPDEEAFQHVLESVGCRADTVLFLDDNQLNVDAALSLGIGAFRVQGVAQARAVLERNGVFSERGA